MLKIKEMLGKIGIFFGKIKATIKGHKIVAYVLLGTILTGTIGGAVYLNRGGLFKGAFIYKTPGYYGGGSFDIGKTGDMFCKGDLTSWDYHNKTAEVVWTANGLVDGYTVDDVQAIGDVIEGVKVLYFGWDLPESKSYTIKDYGRVHNFDVNNGGAAGLVDGMTVAKGWQFIADHGGPNIAAKSSGGKSVSAIYSVTDTSRRISATIKGGVIQSDWGFDIDNGTSTADSSLDSAETTCQLDISLPVLPKLPVPSCSGTGGTPDNNGNTVVTWTVDSKDTADFTAAAYHWYNDTTLKEITTDSEQLFDFTPETAKTLHVKYGPGEKPLVDFHIIYDYKSKNITSSPGDFYVDKLCDSPTLTGDLVVIKAATAAAAEVTKYKNEMATELKTVEAAAKKADDALNRIKSGWLKIAEAAVEKVQVAEVLIRSGYLKTAKALALDLQKPTVIINTIPHGIDQQPLTDEQIKEQIANALTASNEASSTVADAVNTLTNLSTAFKKIDCVSPPSKTLCDTIPKIKLLSDQAKADKAAAETDYASIGKAAVAAENSYKNAVKVGAENVKSNAVRQAILDAAAIEDKKAADLAASNVNAQRVLAEKAAKNADTDATNTQTLSDQIDKAKAADAAGLIAKALAAADDAQTQADNANAAVTEANAQAALIPAADPVLKPMKTAADADAAATQKAATAAQTSAGAAKSTFDAAKIVADGLVAAQTDADKQAADKIIADAKAKQDIIDTQKAADAAAAKIITDAAAKQAAIDKKAADDAAALKATDAQKAAAAAALKAADAKKIADAAAIQKATDAKIAADAAAKKAGDAAKAARASKCPGIFYPTDISGSPYEGAIKTMYDLCIIKGYADETFRPKQNLTRAEAAKIVLLAGGHAEIQGCYNRSCGSPFNDLDMWQGPIVRAAWDYKIVSGVGLGLYAPNRNITRAEAVALVAKGMAITPHAGCTTANCGAGFPNNFFNDIKLMWQGPYLRALWDRGAIEADSKGRFYPDIPVSRGQIVDWVVKVMNK